MSLQDVLCKELAAIPASGAAENAARGIGLARVLLSNAFKWNAEFLTHSKGVREIYSMSPSRGASEKRSCRARKEPV
jgi:hypothetical protein